MHINIKKTKIYTSVILALAIFCTTGTVFAVKNTNNAELTRNVINNPTETNISAFIKGALKEYKKAYKANNLEVAGDCLRAALYFLSQKPNSSEYQDAKAKYDALLSKMEMDTSQASRLELAKSLYLENKPFASAYEFSSLLKEGYEVDVCYEFLGNIAEVTGQNASAVEFYKRAIESNQDNISAKYRCALLFLKLNRTNDAILYLEDVIEKTNSSRIINDIISTFTARINENPNDENNYGILGLAYQKLGEYNKTYQLLKKSLLINPNDIFLRYYLGNLLFDIKEYTFADEIYSEILEENPYESQIRIARAKAYIANNKKEKALKDYQIVLAMYPDSLQAQYGIYSLYRGVYPLEKIINLFYPLERDYKLTSEGYDNLGYFANKFGKTEDACVFFEKSLALNPKSETPYIELYKAYQVLGQNDRAKNIIERAYKLFPKNSEILNMYSSLNSGKINEKNNVALSYLNEGEYKKAIAVYAQIEPKGADTYEAIGNCYRQLGDFKNSILNYKKSLEINQDNSEVYYLLGVAYLEANNKKLAKDAFVKSLEKNPKNIKSKKMITFIEQKEIANSLDMAYASYEKKDYQAALKHLNKAVENFPNDSKVYFYRGLTKEALNDYKGAVADFKDTVKIDRNYVSAYYKLAENLERINKPKDALYMYEKFLGAENIDREFAKKAEKRVIELGEKYY